MHPRNVCIYSNLRRCCAKTYPGAVFTSQPRGEQTIRRVGGTDQPGQGDSQHSGNYLCILLHISFHLLLVYESIILYPANIVQVRHSLASLAWQVQLNSLNSLCSLLQPYEPGKCEISAGFLPQRMFTSAIPLTLTNRHRVDYQAGSLDYAFYALQNCLQDANMPQVGSLLTKLRKAQLFNL